MSALSVVVLCLRRRLGVMLLAGMFGALFMAPAWSQTTPSVQAVPPLTARVMDLTRTLTSEQIQRIEAPMAQLESRRGTQMVVLMVPTTAPEDIASYAYRVASDWKLGHQKTGEGLIVVLALNDHQVRIEVARALEGDLPDVLVHRIIQNSMTPAFKSGDYAQGILGGVNALTAQLLDPRKALAKPEEPPSDRVNLHTFGRMMAITGVLAWLILWIRPGGRWGKALAESTGGVIFSTLGAGLAHLPGMLFDWAMAAYVGYFIGLAWFMYQALTKKLDAPVASAVDPNAGKGTEVRDANGKVIGRILTERPKAGAGLSWWSRPSASGGSSESSWDRSDGVGSSDSSSSDSSGSSSYSSDGGGSYGGGGASSRW